MIQKFERLDRKIVDSNRVFDYCKDTLRLPDGRTTVYETLLHKGAAAVVPVLDDGRILLVRQLMMRRMRFLSFQTMPPQRMMHSFLLQIHQRL